MAKFEKNAVGDHFAKKIKGMESNTNGYDFIYVGQDVATNVERANALWSMLQSPIPTAGSVAANLLALARTPVPEVKDYTVMLEKTRIDSAHIEWSVYIGKLD